VYTFSQIDSIIHQTLYGYGLEFSYDWAVPYWNISRVAFAIGWVVVALAVGFQVYLLTRKAPVAAAAALTPELKEEARWSTFRLGDGSTIRVKLVVKGARRLSTFAADGTPMYAVDTENIVRVVEVPNA
jgi:hypothetical protein